MAVLRLPNLEQGFPKLLAAGYEKTSNSTDFPPAPGAYNCIAWAANDSRCWWWPNSPDSYWPAWIRSPEETVACFVRTFQWLGYRVCSHSGREPRYEKVVLYAMHPSGIPVQPPQNMNDLRDWEPKHMARQLPDGTWTSKCGPDEDITHYTLDALESYGPRYVRAQYGCPVLYMKRHVFISRLVRFAQRIIWKFEKI